MMHGSKTKGRAPLWPVLLALVLGSPVSALADGQAAPLDLRVLIDVSGSMKHNDPRNLRAPALRLLVELLPEGARSGVWTFAEGVHMPVGLGPVDAAWKGSAREASRNIHSSGQLTDMESALRQATFDWHQAEPAGGRYLILLTDGMVDVAQGDDPRDSESRRRIIETLLPKLRAAGVTVHAVALSEHADHALLDRLARATDGWYEKAQGADELNRIFLQLFEQSVPVEGLPVADNRFRVDESIRDMTVVAFRGAEQPTALVGPDDARYTVEDHPDTVRWHAEPGYDMVTVAEPAAGQWQIQGAADPDNRVLVVTNLRLDVAPIPNHIVVGGELAVEARLLRGDELLDDPDFLKLTTFEFERRAEGGSVVSAGLHDDAQAPDDKADDGVYGLNVDTELDPGTYELHVRARGETFAREHRHMLRVHASPVDVEIEGPGAEEDAFRVLVTPDPGLLSSAEATLTVHLPEGETPVVERRDTGGWIVRVARGHAEQELALRVEGKAPDGRAVVSTLRRALPAAPAPAGEADPEEAADEPSVDWLWVALVVTLVNLGVLGLLIGGYFAWRWWRNRPRQAEATPQAEAVAND